MNNALIFDTKSIILFSSAIINLGVFFYLLLSKTRTPEASKNYLAITTLSVAIWMFASWVNHFTPSPDVVAIFSRISYASTLWAVIGFGLFGLNYNRRQSMTWTIFAVGLLISILTLFTNGIIVTGIPATLTTGEDASFGNFYWLWSLLLGALAVFTVIVLINTVIRSTGTKRAKIELIIVLFLITICLVLFFNLVLPNLGITNLMFIGQYATLIFAVGSAWVVVQERIYSIRYMIANSLAIGCTGIILFLLSWSTQKLEFYYFHWDVTSLADERIILFGIFIGCLVAIFVGRLYPMFNNFFYRIFRISILEIEEIEDWLINNSNKYIDLDKYISDFLRIIKNKINTRGALLFMPSVNRIWSTEKHNPLSDEERKRILKVARFDLEDEREGKKFPYVAALENEGVNIAYLCLQHKSNDGYFSREELDKLANIIKILSIAMNRYILYEKQKEFNVLLQKRIDAATALLRIKNIKLAENLRFERDMLDILGHELRTPLSIARNAVVMSTGMLAEKPLPLQKLKEYNDMAVENVVREIGLLETLLSATKIDNNRLQLTLDKVDLIDVISDSLTGLMDKANKKGLKVKFTKPEQAFVFADRTRIQEVSDNLIDNAIKYTDQGGVEITVDIKDGLTSLMVKDTGRGIPKEELPSIGKKFYRVDNYLKSSKDSDLKVVRPGGTGLGLYVTFSLVKAMGGKITVDSHFGQSSTFTASFVTWKNQPSKTLNDVNPLTNISTTPRKS